MLPMKRMPSSAESSSNASAESSSPFPGSSPMLRSPTLGSDRPSASRTYTLPRCANCTRCDGLQSTLAPASTRRQSSRAVGSSAPTGGRSTPGSGRSVKSDEAMTAPVDPALTNASASPSLCSRSPTTIDDSGFLRITEAGESAAVTRSGAWWIVRPGGTSSCFASSVRIVSSSPTRTISTSSPSYARSASIAPPTSGPGARSVPMASSAMRMTTSGCQTNSALACRPRG